MDGEAVPAFAGVGVSVCECVCVWRGGGGGDVHTAKSVGVHSYGYL